MVEFPSTSGTLTTVKNLIAILVACGVIVGFATVSRGADDVQQPGVALTFANGAAGGTGYATRVSRSISLYVPAGSAAASQNPTAAGGGYSANFQGNLNLRLRSFVKFHAEGSGRLMLQINGVKVLEAAGDDLSQVVSEEVRLNKGKNILIADYAPSATKDAALRLFWESKSFASEPVPATLFTHDVPADAIASSIQRLEGQALVGQFRCLKCHTGADKGAPQPEFFRDAPDLADVGSRLQGDWLAAWISDPQKIRASAHMPVTLHGLDAAKTASDIAAYLMLLGKPATELKDAGDAAVGGRLFSNLECVVCHTPPAGEEDKSRIPLKLVAAKFQPAALEQYLLDPAKHYAWNPMPRFALSATEAADLAAYLSTGGEASPKAVAGDAAVGKTAFVSAGCAKCHPGADDTIAAKPVDLSNSTGNAGCLADVPDAKVPHFTFSDEQRAAIRTAIKTHANFALRSDAELAEAAIHELRCTACHARDATESLLSQSLAGASQELQQLFPNPAPGPTELLATEQRFPSLTFAGEKLRPEWMEQFIGGKLNYKPRYFLRARMPAFAPWASTLAKGMTEQHGLSPRMPEVPKPKADLIEPGRALAGKVANVGFSCIQCHPVANVPPFAPFEAPSVNFQYIAERLRPDYYNRWMHDPARMDTATKMPRFADADDKTGLAAFDHDAGKQFDAVWQYLLTGRKIQPPQ